MNEALPLFLGFDLSTQQLKVTALYPATHRNGQSSALKTHSSFAVQFDSDLAHYQTRGGVSIQHDTDNGTVTAPVLMWVEALELVLDRMKESQFPFERVLAISGAAQVINDRAFNLVNSNILS
jgi:xylulokinase